jgi:diguanylate cyclase (GGDEF)-like protein
VPRLLRRLAGGAAWLLATGTAAAATAALASVAAPAAATASAAPTSAHDRLGDPLGDPRFATVGASEIPRGVVASVAQDAAGFLWLGTGDGLVRFDGQHFRPQERDTVDPVARNLGWIRALLGGRDGRLWIGTEADGLAVYDPHTDSVRDLGNGEDRVPAQAPPLPTVRALAEDRDGSVWVGSVGGGLAQVDAAGQRFTHHRAGSGAGALPDDRVLALQVDRAGHLWVGHWGGLALRRAGSTAFEPVTCPSGAAGLTGAAVQALRVAADGQIWLGTAQGGLARVDPASARCTAVAGTPTDAPVTQLAQDADGSIWVGRTLGIDLLDPADGRLLRRLRHDPARPSGLGANEVSALLRDRAGALWVGSFGGGLQRVDAVQRPLRVRRGDAVGLFDNPDARALLARPDAGLWTALADGRLVAFDAALRVRGPALPGVAPAGRIDALAAAPDGGVWLGSDGLVRAVGPDGRLRQRLPHGSGLTHRLWRTADGRLWVGTQDGLYVQAPGATALQRVALTDGQPWVGDVFALAEDGEGALWAGGVRGLFRVPAGGDALQPVESPVGAGLASPLVLGLLFDGDGRLWVDTAVAGLHRRQSWDGRQAGFDRVSARHGVRNRPFGVNLLQDRRGRIWSHMYVYDPAADRMHELAAADGADMGTGWFRAYAPLADGRLVFGGSRGLLVVEPERYDPPGDPVPVVISGLRINGQPARVAGLAQGLDIRPGQRSFSVEFAALDYADPQRTRYRYRLDGVDPDWIDTGAAYRQASYGNLAPGAYRLRVRASNRAGVWNPAELTLPIRVWPAWWQTLWARVLFALLAVALTLAVAWGAVHRRTTLLRRRQTALALEVAERTADLRRMAEALRAQSVALEQASLTDPLTGLHNRRYLNQHIDADCALALRRWTGHDPRAGEPPAQADLVFFVCDIDHFKAVNDRHGHAAGDAVLRQMRQRLQQVFRESDHLVRWGGEEFLVVARDTDRAHAPELAERLCRTVADTPVLLDDGTPLAASVSVGFAAFPPAPERPDLLGWEDVVGIADAAMLAVKRARRGHWAGLIRARAGSADAVLAAVHRPVEQWANSDGLDWAASVTLQPPGSG